MNHYLYLLEFGGGMKYVGARSTHLIPSLDASYLGSGKALPPRTRSSCIKIILGVYPSRQLLMQAEIEFIVLNDCVKSKFYYNLRKQTFDKHGMADTSGPALQGRTKETHKYIREANKKRIQYTGQDRTPAQKVSDAKLRGVSTGPNLAKGRPGVTNSGFTPWYYVDPTGNYFEMLHITRQEFAPTIGATPRQVGHRFHHTNIHKQAGRAATKVLRGYTFGCLPRPIQTDAV